MSERRAIVTGRFGAAYQRLSEISLPGIRDYATRVGAKLIVLENRRWPSWPVIWEKLQIGEILKEYGFDRLAWLDVDMILNPSAPDIFAATPDDSFCALDEGKFFEDRAGQIYADAAFYGMENAAIRPRGFHYFNSGVMVVPRTMHNVFRRPTRPKPDSIMPEQTYLNVSLAHLGYRFHDLGILWNGLHSIRGPEDRLDLWTVHYAGWPRTPDWVDRVIAQMHVDADNWKRRADELEPRVP